MDAGIKVYTTLDLNLDTYAIQRAQYYITQRHNMEWPTYCPIGCYNVPPLAQSDNVHNAAVMAMDPYTGDILAMVGSVDYTSRDPKVDGFYNTATSESRSLGSSTKPVFYATAFQMGWNPGIMMQDAPVCFPNPTGDTSGPGGKPVPDFATPGCGGAWYTPHNFDNHSFSGNIPLRYGLANSLNVPATEMMSFVGDSPDYSTNAISMATRMGITSLAAELDGTDDGAGHAIDLALAADERLWRLCDWWQACSAALHPGDHIPPSGWTEALYRATATAGAGAQPAGGVYDHIHPDR